MPLLLTDAGNMPRVKLIVFSILAAVALTAIQVWAAVQFWFAILWQVNLMLWLAGPGPVIGYGANGAPLHEGTPVHMVAAFLGLAIGAIVYAALIYFTLKRMWFSQSPESEA